MIIRTLLAVILLGTAIARADTTSERLLKQDIDRQEQERRDRRWDEPRTSTPLPAPELERASGQPASDTCFSIREIHVTQAQILPAKPLARLIAAYEGRCLSSSDLQALQQGMNSLALSRGLVTTRVVIPEQNLSSGILQLEVWPGHMEAATLNSPYRMELEAALPLSNGDVLNLRALEQAIDNLNRLESLQASVELRPGEKPGGSIAAFTVNRLQPWHLAAVWDSEAMEQHPLIRRVPALR
jgi:hemolysin activation/secretion protein